MMNPLRPFMGELELRELRLNDTIERLEQQTIDRPYADVLEAELDELHSEMLDLEDRLSGLHTALMAASHQRS